MAQINCKKNTGLDKYAFNSIQRKVLPEPYRCVCLMPLPRECECVRHVPSRHSKHTHPCASRRQGAAVAATLCAAGLDWSGLAATPGPPACPFRRPPFETLVSMTASAGGKIT